MASPAGTHSVIRFGAFEVDAAIGELRKAGISLKIHPQPFRVLLLLAEHPGQIVTREEIQRSLWGDNTFVDFERGINFCINQIRAALGDDAEKPRYVETLPRRGYRFIAPANTIVAPEVEEHVSERRPADPEFRPVVVPAEDTRAPLHRGATVHIRKRNYLLPALALVAALVTVAAMVAVVGWWRAKRAIPHELKDTIVLADFSNSTGDPVFDGTLRQGLTVQLQQSPSLSLISDERIRQTLLLMGRPTDTRLTPDMGREVCQRTASAVAISGSIARLGNQYVLGLKAVDCGSGDSVAEEQETADGKEKVLAALSQATTKLRGRLGESLKSVERFDVPLEQATTSSLDALQAYSQGHRAFAGGDKVAAIPALERAVRLDPNFATAYVELGVNYATTGEVQLGFENIHKAFELRDQVSAREKFYIETSYHYFATGNVEKAREVCELWVQTYPRDSMPVAYLGLVLLNLGQFEKALPELREGLRGDPESPIRYGHLAWTYVMLNRFKEAHATIEDAQAKKFDSPDLHVLLYGLAFLEKSSAAMASEVAWSAGKPGYEDYLLNLEARVSAYYGKVEKSRELTDRAMALAERTQRKDTAAGYEAAQAIAEALFGNGVEARKRAAAALRLSSDRGALSELAATAALLADTARAQALADDLDKRFPDSTILQNSWLPIIHAQLALVRNDPRTAIDLLQRAKFYELSPLGDDLASAFVRGNSYLAAHRSGEAAAEFQKILDHQGAVLFRPWRALAHLGLARAYASQGEAAKAKAAYLDFLALWKDADPDIPILKQAKAEYAKLK
jgi:eukaryotic-like serine/threonine-protein kinase